MLSISHLLPGSEVDLRFVVNHERTVRVLKSGVGGQNRVVWLNNRCRHLGGGVDRELELGLLAVVGG